MVSRKFYCRDFSECGSTLNDFLTVELMQIYRLKRVLHTHNIAELNEDCTTLQGHEFPVCSTNTKGGPNLAASHRRKWTSPSLA